MADVESEIERYREYARATSKKDMRVNIRLSKKDTKYLLPLGTHRATFEP